MLAFAGFITMLAVVALIMSKRVSVTVALCLVPIITGIAIGEWGNLGVYITDGIKRVAPNAAMFSFSILFFGIMSDVGVFDVIIHKIMKLIGKDPVKICIGAYITTFIAHLDGAGAITCIITLGAFMPVFKKMKMDRRNLLLILAMVAGIMNAIPWGGPTMRAMVALGTSTEETFTAMLPVLGVGLAVALAITVWIGVKEKKRLGHQLDLISLEIPKTEDLSPEQAALRRPKLLVVNMLLTVAAIVALLAGVLNNAAVFMVATALALLINFRKPSEQLERVSAHAPNAMSMVSILFAAGILNGVLTNTGMLTAMASALIGWLPNALGKHLPALVGVFSVPLGMVSDPDSFYYAVLPMLAETGEVYGIPAVTFARAAMVGHTTVGWTISPLIGTTFLMVGMGEVELGDHQKYSGLILWGLSISMLIAAILMGLIPL